MDTRKIAKDYGLNVVHVNKNNIGRVAEKYDIDKKNLKNMEQRLIKYQLKLNQLKLEMITK